MRYPSIRRCLAGFVACALAACASAQTSAPATRPAGAAPFQPGLRIDWNAREVLADARVVLREGPLEFFAAFAGKEHESILRFDARPLHLFQALGLAALAPGRPPGWDEAAQRYTPPEGDLVDVEVRWTDADGGERVAAAHEWLTEIEYSRPPLPRPWVFGGSQVLRDGSLAADRTGAGLALVDLPDALLSPSRSRVSRDADLWAIARTDAIPALETRVIIVFRAARPRPLRIELDFRGVATVDGQFAVPDDVVDLLEIQQRLRPAEPQPIIVRGTLASDLRRWRERFAAAGLPESAVVLEHAPR